MRKLISLAFALLLFCFTALAQRTILHCGKLIDVVKGETLSAYSIIIEGNKIVDVRGRICCGDSK